MQDPPRTRYAKTADGVHIAYQVVGDGPRDLVFVPGLVNHLDFMWQDDNANRFFSAWRNSRASSSSTNAAPGSLIETLAAPLWKTASKT